MPQTVDNEKMKGMATFDVSAAQGSPYGIPVKQIPVLEYPRVVYKWPSDPFYKVEHRNAAHEIVHIETLPAEHLAKTVENEKEFKKALADGWVKDGYVPPPLPDPNAHLYDPPADAKKEDAK